jgi:hypothetical protein
MGNFQSNIFFDLLGFLVWIPAFAGMTGKKLVFTGMTKKVIGVTKERLFPHRWESKIIRNELQSYVEMILHVWIPASVALEIRILESLLRE